jgi:hypothetical protein
MRHPLLLALSCVFAALLLLYLLRKVYKAIAKTNLPDEDDE